MKKHHLPDLLESRERETTGSDSYREPVESITGNIWKSREKPGSDIYVIVREKPGSDVYVYSPGEARFGSLCNRPGVAWF